MASESVTDVEQRSAIGNIWVSTAIAGIIGGVVFGVMMQMMMLEIMTMAIPGMYGLGPGLALGWVLHLFHSAVFGLIYAGIVQFDPVSRYADRVGPGAGVGLLYGLVVWIVAASIIMPAWVGAVLPMNPPVPDFNPMSLIGHLVYGIILGVLYPILSHR